MSKAWRRFRIDDYLRTVVCICGQLLVATHAAAHDMPPRVVVPVFEDGEAQVVAGFNNPEDWIRHDLWVETDFDSDQDGKLDRMHVSITRPWQTQFQKLKLPVVYITSPYFAGTGSTDTKYFWDPRQEVGKVPKPREIPPPFQARESRPIISRSHVGDWVPRGYIVVHSSSPGTGLSQGCPTVGGENEALAPKAVIDWLCGRRKGYTEIDGDTLVDAHWCSGKVGMTGTSYNGTLPIAAATTGVEGLEAIIPIAPNTSYYHYYRSHGLVRHPGGYVGEDIDVLFDFIHSGSGHRREFCDCEIRDHQMALGQDRATGDYNEFWASRDYLHQLESMQAAMLMAHAFNDWNVMPEHSVRVYMAAREQNLPVQIYMHQQGHGGPPPFSQMNRWFTRFLHGVENGVEAEPKAWIVREGKPRDEPTSYDDYPHPTATDVSFYPMTGGTRQGQLRLQPSGEEALETLIDNFSFSGETLAQAEWTEHRLLYATPPLTSAIHLSGYPRVAVRVSVDRPAANLSIWLVSLPWNAKAESLTENLITRGWADPQNYRSLSYSEPLTPDKFYELEFDLQPDDQIIAPGQQVGLMIFSSDRDFTLRPDPGTRLTVDLSATRLILPVVGGEAAVERALERPPRPKL